MHICAYKNSAQNQRQKIAIVTLLYYFDLKQNKRTKVRIAQFESFATQQ